MDVSRLRALRAVVTTGSVGAAAAALGYTPSAVSQQLAVLQREAGVTLVERRGRGIEPTAAGRRLAEAAAPVFEALGQLDAVVADLRHGRVGSISCHFFASAGSTWVPPVAATVAREFPDLRLDLRLVELEPVGEPDVELGIATVGDDQRAGYDTCELLVEPYLAVVPAGDPLAARGEVRLRELEHATWVDNDVARGACRRILLAACAAAGFAPAFRVETQDYRSAIGFVAQGSGVTVVPRLGLGDLPTGVATVALTDPTPTRRIVLRTRRASAAHPAVRRLTELLRAAAGAPVPGALDARQ